MSNLNLLLEKFNDLNNLLKEHSFELVIVGGIVRNHFFKPTNFNSDNYNDYDFEINYIGIDRPFGYKICFTNLVRTLQLNYNAELCSFNVIKFLYNNFEVELAPARIEKYLKEKFPYGHSDFEIELIESKDYLKSFLRRDFTMNALAYDFNKTLIDPYNGLQDIKNKVLNNCGVEFTHDPVRFLRLIRFHIILKFTIGDNLLNLLGKFDLSKLTHYYFFVEGFKSGDLLLYTKKYLSICNQYNIKRPSWDNILDDLVFNFNQNYKIIQNKFELISFLSQKKIFETEYIYQFAKILGVKKKLIKELLK